MVASTDTRRIYVRAPNWVGDFVMATGAFERLRRGYPEAHITIAARPHLLDLLSGSDWADATLTVPKAKGVRGLWRQVREVRQGAFDLAIVLPNSPETGLVPFLAAVRTRLGYRQGRPGLMNLGLRAPRNRKLFVRHGPRRVPEPMPGYYARLLDLLEIPAGQYEVVLRVTDEDRRMVDAWVAERGLDGRRLLLLTAGAAYGASKLWDFDRYAACARLLAAREDLAPVFLAGPAEVEMAERLAHDSGTLAATQPVLTLGQLKALVERSHAMITTDTGPRHISLAFGKPTVCLIGPSDPRYTNYALEHSELIRRDLDCMPCQRKICPLGHNDCMRTIEIDTVVDALGRLTARIEADESGSSSAELSS